MRSLDTDYLVVGAGAMGMAFTDALIDHADVHVTLVDRRHVAGGHWNDAYPFVQLHQASVFYGVASTARLAAHADAGLARLAVLAHEPLDETSRIARLGAQPGPRVAAGGFSAARMAR